MPRRKAPTKKKTVPVMLEGVHLRLLRDLMPYFGNSISEVGRSVILRWLEQNLGSPHLERLRKKGAIR